MVPRAPFSWLGRPIDPDTWEYPPIPLNCLLPRIEFEYDRKSHPFPSARPPIIALVIDWIIKVLITHPSSSGCAARRTAPPSAHPSSYLPRYHSTVFHAMANYLLRRSMNSNRNYISPDIQLGLPARPTRLSGTEKKERTIESSL